MSAMLYDCNRTRDAMQTNGDNIYVRIKQVDKDGSFKYSKPVNATLK